MSPSFPPNPPHPGYKRYRDEAGGTGLDAQTDLPEHPSKRVQLLPVRGSPHSLTQHYQTSANLDFHIHHNHGSHSSPWPAASSLGPPANADIMDTSEISEGNLQQQYHPEPEPSHPHSFQPMALASDTTTRIPTPIHCNFPRPQMPTSLTSTFSPEQKSGLRHQHTPSVSNEDPSVPRSHDFSSDWALTKDHYLPSPIREGVGSDDDHDLVSGQCSLKSYGHPYGRLPPDGPSPEAAAQADNNAMDIDSTATSSPKRGHTRSRHTVNGWTLQPGMKRSLSIGYRPDCEKCRSRVPGHFNHIIIS